MTPEARQLVVVGAGFAGLACARAAACRGVDTVVIDRHPAAGRNVRTTGILVKEVADAWDVPRRLTRTIGGARLYGPSGRSIDLDRPGYHFLATDTPGILEWWAREAARAGAELRWSIPYRGAVERPGGGLWLDGTDLGCDLLVGADGARSAVARSRGLEVNRQFLIGVEAEVEGVRGPAEDRLHVFLDSKVAHGYIGWVVPGLTAFQIGCAARRPRRPDLRAFMARLAGLFDLSGAHIVGHRSGPIPVGGPLRRIADRHTLLIGDAAGWVSPLTAGGIHGALAWGRVAGVAIADHLLGGGPPPAVAIRRRVPSFSCKRWMRRLYDLGPGDRLLDLLIACRPARRAAQLVFFHHRGLLGREAWGRHGLRIGRSGARTPERLTPSAPAR